MMSEINNANNGGHSDWFVVCQKILRNSYVKIKFIPLVLTIFL